MKNFRPISNLLGIAAWFWVLFMGTSCGDPNVKQAQDSLSEFIAEYESKIIPVMKELNTTKFDAAVSGSEEDYTKAAKLEITLAKIYSNKESFNKLKSLKESGFVKDSILSRQLNVLYNEFLPYQLNEDTLVQIIMLENQIAKKMANFRANVDDKSLTNSEIETILKSSTDQNLLRKVWEASKKVGEEINTDLIKLIKMRNGAAQQLGYTNYWEMSLLVSDQDPDDIQQLYDELDILTRGPYSQLKSEMDEYLAKYHNIAKENLLPWHYQDLFYQNAPRIYDYNFDSIYKNKDILAMANQFYTGIGLPIENVLDKSDLFEKPGKSQVGFTTDIDRQGDVRILLNVQNNYQSMKKLLYECGFGAYYSNISKEIPYTLRTPSHFFTADAVATLFSRFAASPAWMKETLGISQEEADLIKATGNKYIRLDKFVFSRWAQVVYRFERGLYENPDQDLNALWWELVKRYQFLNMPAMRNAPDWAAKSHLATAPCSYHNYMLGELFASQLEMYIAANVTKEQNCETTCVNNPEVGKFLKERVFAPGKTLNWNELIEYATKEELTADYFTRQYIRL